MFCTRCRFVDQFMFLRFLSASPKAVRKESKPEALIRRKGELLYGLAPCIAALHAKRRKIYGIYQKRGSLEKKEASKRAGISDTQLHKLAEELRADKQWVDGDTLDKVTGQRPHQGLVLDVAPLNMRRMDITDCNLPVKERDEYPVWLLLDEVQDPMNFGAILRVSYFLGVTRVISSLKNCCPLSPTVSKASAGVMEIMPVYSVPHLQNFLSAAKEYGWSILGTTGFSPGNENTKKPRSEGKEKKEKQKMSKTMDCQNYVKNSPVLLVVGNEGRGMHREVEEMCDTMLTVKPNRPLPPTLDSLNVAVATGILLHALQRHSVS